MRFFKILHRLLKYIIPVYFYEIIRRKVMIHFASRLEILSKCITKINADYPQICIRVLDIGARNGLEGALKPIYQLNNIHCEGIEPDKKEAAKLLDLKLFEKVHTCAVFDSSGLNNFYVTRAPGCSSILKPCNETLKPYTHSDFFEISEITTLETTTLDNLFPREEHFDFVKIDVQGVEYQVLSGGKALIAKSLGLVLESQFIEVYEEQKLFSDIHPLCLSMGFRLLDLVHSYLGDGEYAEATDCVYIREPSQLKNKEEFLKSVLFALLWKKLGYVEFLFRNYSEKFLSNAEKQKWLSLLEIEIREKIPVFLPQKEATDGAS